MDQKQLLREHFWFLVVFSLLLIFVFAIYLPDRFYWQATQDGHDEVMDEGVPDGAMHEEDLHGGGYESHEEKDILEGLAVNLTATPTPIRTGSSVTLDFFVNEKPSARPVASSELEIESERLMHIIGVRSDMNEFFHIHPHPTSTPGVFTIQGIFSTPGLYKIWSEVKKDGIIYATGHPKISVEGAGQQSEKTVSFERKGIAGDYEVTLDIEEPVQEGHEHELSFDIHTRTGEEAEVENYLGVPMHLTIIRDDLKEFLHTHPEEDASHMSFEFIPTPSRIPRGLAARMSGGLKSFPEDLISYGKVWGFIPAARAHGEVEDMGSNVPSQGDEAINFHVVFPEAGLYKAFAQFRPQGIGLPPDEALKVEFWIRVEPGGLSKDNVWWILVVSSLGAIIILSFIVKKFITVKTKSAASPK